jgi:hypothetical protein
MAEMVAQEETQIVHLALPDLAELKVQQPAQIAAAKQNARVPSASAGGRDKPQESARRCRFPRFLLREIAHGCGV